MIYECARTSKSLRVQMRMYVGLCKSTGKKMNPNVCQRVCTPERKYEYERNYGCEFVSRSESSVVNMSV